MKKVLFGASVVFGLMVAMTGFRSETVSAADKAASIKEVMAKVFNKKQGLVTQLGTSLKAGSVNWDEVQKKSTTLVALAGDLGKNTPKKGDAASWKTHTEDVLGHATKLSEAAGKKDANTAKTEVSALETSCMACHKVHK